MALTPHFLQQPAARSGRGWVWAADGLGLVVLASLTTTAAGAPALAHVCGWLIVALPVAGLVAAAVAERAPAPQPVPVKVIARRTIVITPRPLEVRQGGK